MCDLSRFVTWKHLLDDITLSSRSGWTILISFPGYFTSHILPRRNPTFPLIHHFRILHEVKPQRLCDCFTTQYRIRYDILQLLSPPSLTRYTVTRGLSRHIWLLYLRPSSIREELQRTSGYPNIYHSNACLDYILVHLLCKG
jgi:hypothetical protein